MENRIGMTQPIRAALLAAATFLFIFLVLIVDSNSRGVQLALGTATAVMLALFLRSSSTVHWREALVVVAIATTGEVVLSLGCHLYEYRSGGIPLYVPPGHGLFYLLAMEIRAGLKSSLTRLLTPAIFGAGSVYALVMLWGGGDLWGFIWWLIAFALMLRARDRHVLAVCIAITFVLEIAGTANGNWLWAADVPGLHLQSGNPPSGVGVLYCILDVWTVAVCRLLTSRRPPVLTEPLGAVYGDS